MRTGAPPPNGTGGQEAGQATAELVLAFPVVAVLVLTVIQAVLVAGDHLAVVHVAREAARAASVDPDPGAAESAASAVMPGAVVRVDRPPPGGFLTVVVAYRSPTDLPVVGPVLPDPVLRARAVMRVER